MEYLIAGIRIDIPHRFTTGAFGMALAPFAAGNKSETDAGSNRMAGPVPGTATTAAPSPSETPGTERSAPRPATSPADTAQPDLILRTGLLAGDTAGYCELDAFDFTDADADCRFGRGTEGYLLTMTPRDGSAPARFHKAFGRHDSRPARRSRLRVAVERQNPVLPQREQSDSGHRAAFAGTAEPHPPPASHRSHRGAAAFVPAVVRTRRAAGRRHLPPRIPNRGASPRLPPRMPARCRGSPSLLPHSIR